jgi:hypothetical protein
VSEILQWLRLLTPSNVRSRPTADIRRIIAFITEAAPVERILTHIGEPSRPPQVAPARGPPTGDGAPEPMPDWDLLAQPAPDFEFDQRVAW